MPNDYNAQATEIGVELRQRECVDQWDRVYGDKYMTNWYPNEDIIRFCARLIRRRKTYDTVEVKRDVHKVLDLGCGNGRHAMYFAREGFEVFGIDISSIAIAWATDWSRREGLHPEFRVGDITNLPYADASMDVVVSHGVLDHVPMSVGRRAVDEVHRVLAPGGLFYCDLRATDDFEHGVGEEVEPDTFVITHGYEQGLMQHFFSQDAVRELLTSRFRVIYMETTDHRLAPDFLRKYARWVIAADKAPDGERVTA